MVVIFSPVHANISTRQICEGQPYMCTRFCMAYIYTVKSGLGGHTFHYFCAVHSI